MSSRFSSSLNFFTSYLSFFNSSSSIWRCNGTLLVSTRCGKVASLKVAEILSKSCNTASKTLENRTAGISSTCICLLSISCQLWKVGEITLLEMTFEKTTFVTEILYFFVCETNCCCFSLQTSFQIVNMGQKIHQKCQRCSEVLVY